jgi:hypothetical protein
MGSGKSEVAQHLRDFKGFTIMPYAIVLKAMTRTLLKRAGFSHTHAERMVAGDLKGLPLPELSGATPRYLMQTLGTEWGREGIHQDFWVNLHRRDLARALKEGRKVVIDDVRFPNEADAIKSLGGKVIMVQRPLDGKPDETIHLSEGAMDNYPVDLTIHNNSDLNSLRAQAAALPDL